MNDKAFLEWLHERLVNVHGESPYYDYMHKLRAIIAATPEDQLTPNAGTDNYPRVEEVDSELKEIFKLIDEEEFQKAKELISGLEDKLGSEWAPYDLTRAKALLHFLQ